MIYSDDPEKIEISMKSVEKLCDAYHFELEEICVELLKVLLNKSNVYAMGDFEDIRMNAMISITVHYPKECAIFLTNQFYQAGYTLTQRTDILHVLAMSVQKLSNPNESPIFDKRILKHQNVSNLIPFNLNNSNSSNSDWKEIVKKRIETKTRIKVYKFSRNIGFNIYSKLNIEFKVSAKTSVQKTKENKYSDVYGYFFFPLLRSFDM